MTRPQDSPNANDPLPGLGERIPAETPAKPPATPRPTGTPGVLEGPDGKLYTELPTPKAAAPFDAEPDPYYTVVVWDPPLADEPCPKCGWGRLCFGDCDDSRT